MAFKQGFLIGAVAGGVATLLFTPLQGRDTRAILLGPLGWRESENEPASDWSPQSSGIEVEHRPATPTV